MNHIEMTEIRKIGSQDIRKLSDDSETSFLSIRVPDTIEVHFEAFFDRYESRKDRVEVARDLLFAEWHRDTGRFVYWLDLDDDVLYVTDMFDCGYLNVLIAGLG